MRYAAFLRAVNVGGHVVKMDALKKLFVKLGFTNVETFIASGNVVFETPSRAAGALEQRIGSAIERALGYEVVTFLRTSNELADIAAYVPFRKPVDTPTFLVGFLHSPLNAGAVKKLMAFASAQDEFHVRGREMWWRSSIGQGKSVFSNKVFEKALGVRTTLRNVRTVRAMAEKWGEAG